MRLRYPMRTLAQSKPFGFRSSTSEAELVILKKPIPRAQNLLEFVEESSRGF